MLYDQAPGVYLYDLKSVLLVPNDLQMRNSLNVNYPFVTFFYPIKLKG